MLDVQWTDEHFEVKVPGLGVSASGATFDEAVDNAHCAISAVLERRAQRKTIA